MVGASDPLVGESEGTLDGLADWLGDEVGGSVEVAVGILVVGEEVGIAEGCRVTMDQSVTGQSYNVILRTIRTRFASLSATYNVLLPPKTIPSIPSTANWASRALAQSDVPDHPPAYTSVVLRRGSKRRILVCDKFLFVCAR